jgi:lysylphosphatidylglycerol synthetase-like protein (DUF2156 family)
VWAALPCRRIAALGGSRRVEHPRAWPQGELAQRVLMDGMLTHVFRWGQEHGHRWFNLGMAPLSGVRASRATPMWNRSAGFVYRDGESFYTFKGLRGCKEKCHPVWAARTARHAGSGWHV